MFDWPIVLILAEAAEAAKAEGGGDSPFGGLLTFAPIIAIGILFYFMLLRPERKKSSEMAQMLKGLKKNDHVLTIGGIYGTVVNVQEGSDTVTIRVDENTNAKMRVRRSAISQIVTEETPAKEENA